MLTPRRRAAACPAMLTSLKTPKGRSRTDSLCARSRQHGFSMLGREAEDLVHRLTRDDDFHQVRAVAEQPRFRRDARIRVFVMDHQMPRGPGSDAVKVAHVFAER